MKNPTYEVTLRIGSDTFIFYPNQGRGVWLDGLGVLEFHIKDLKACCDEIIKKRKGIRKLILN